MRIAYETSSELSLCITPYTLRSETTMLRINPPRLNPNKNSLSPSLKLLRIKMYASETFFSIPSQSLSLAI